MKKHMLLTDAEIERRRDRQTDRQTERQTDRKLSSTRSIQNGLLEVIRYNRNINFFRNQSYRK